MAEERLCYWCEKPVSKKRINGFCGDSCEKDCIENHWPSWMNGRIGKIPNQEWHMTGDYLCLSAPNKFRNLYRKRLSLETVQKNIINLQSETWPHLKNPLGLDFDYPSFDQVIIWLGPTVRDTF
jgi:hypothetical protein